jgi:phytoene synthase
MDSDLATTLAPLPRLALSYAPGRARVDWLTLLALDARFAAVLRQSREPMIGQIRLAWWRDRLNEPVESWPTGEPLLARLRSWQGDARKLIPLVDGWEALLGEPPLSSGAFTEFAAGRAAAIDALADQLDVRAPRAGEYARCWALADLALHLGDPSEQLAVRAMLAAENAAGGGLPRELRPLILLTGLSARAVARGDEGKLASFRALLAGMRLGLLGR